MSSADRPAEYSLVVPAGASYLPSDAFLGRLADGVLAFLAGGAALTLRLEDGAGAAAACMHAHALHRAIRSGVKVPDAPSPLAALAAAPPGPARPIMAQLRLDEWVRLHLLGCTRGDCLLRLAALESIRDGCVKR